MVSTRSHNSNSLSFVIVDNFANKRGRAVSASHTAHIYRCPVDIVRQIYNSGEVEFGETEEV